MNTNSKGFTIIELIVVIGVIAVLASIVLSAVSGYYSKAKDASIKANLTTAITAAANYFTANYTYVGLCSDNTSGFLNAYNAAVAQKKTGGTSNCSATSTEWSASVQLNNPEAGGKTGGWWCVDFQSTKKEATSDPYGSTTCP